MARRRKSYTQAVSGEASSSAAAQRDGGRRNGKDPVTADTENPDPVPPELPQKKMEEYLKLQASDHPGMQLVAAPLTATNFLQWSRSIRRGLGARNKLAFIDGTFSEPDEDKEFYNDWIKTDSMVAQWMINSMSKDVVNAFSHYETSEKLWSALMHRFGRSNGPKTYKLQREIMQFKQGNQNVFTYYSNLTNLWNELDLLLPPITCVCDAEDTYIIREEHQRLVQFLVGLNEIFEQTRRQIMLLEPLPSVEQAYGMIVQVEDQMELVEETGGGTDRMVMQVGRQGQNYSGNKGYIPSQRRMTKEDRAKLKCSHCQANGHEVGECFKLHGYPEWYKKLKEGKNARINYVEDDDDVRSRSDSGKPMQTDGAADIGKVIQMEIAKYMGHLMQKGQSQMAGGDTINLVHKELHKDEVTQNPFDTQYAFSVLSSMEKNVWIIDSGASSHVCCDVDLMVSTYKYDKPLLARLPDGTAKEVYCGGSVRINKDIYLEDVMLIPDFTHNLLSVSHLVKDSQAKCVFLPQRCIIQKQGTETVLGIGKMVNNLYVMEIAMENHFCHVYNPNPRDMSLETWHIFLGHASITAMRHMSMFKGQFTDEAVANIEKCEVCLLAKQSRNEFPTLNSRTDALFDMVHADIWGPYGEDNIDNARYVLTIVEDHSRCIWTYLLRSKEQVHSTLRTYFKLIQTQFGRIIKVLRTDNGSEFVNKQMRELLEELGMFHQRSCPYTPQQNGVVERRHRMLLNSARALMFQSSLPLKFWPYSILTATWLLNRVPSQVLDWKTPHELLFGTEADLSILKPFGCLAYAVNLSPHRDKFDARSNKCVFIGFVASHKGYLLYDLKTEKLLTSRDVRFVVGEFPFASPQVIATDTTLTALDHGLDVDQEHDSEDMQMKDCTTNLEIPTVRVEQNVVPMSQHSPPLVVDLPAPHRRSNRVRKTPDWMQDFIGHINTDVLPPFPAGASSPPTFPFLISPSISEPYIGFLFNITTTHEPKNYKEACKVPQWVDAMQAELDALRKNQTWNLVPLPQGKKAIGSKWVYKLKLKPNGEVERYKARLVAKGYDQEYGIDYQEVFSPVAKFVTVRVLFAIASLQHWCIQQVDVNNAFLHGYLHDEIYMEPPKGYTDAQPGEVCKLVKSLYGLKQASREWNQEFCKTLFGQGFTQSMHDHCLFYKGAGNTFICILVYVDDVLICSPSESLISDLKNVLHTAFTIKDLGVAHYFIGMEIARGSSGVALNQRKYILDLVDTVGLSTCTSVSTPLPPGVHLCNTTDSLLTEPETYRKLVGRLLYLNLTRPDITYAVQQLSQFVSAPAKSHMDAALHVVKYLKGCPSLGLFFPSVGTLTLQAFCDADWGSCPDSRRSLTGYCIFLGSSLISWRCKKQNTVSSSTAEAEYRAMGFTVRELQWISYLLQDFDVQIPTPINLYCNNSAALHITRNPVFHERTKHLEMDCHIVRDQYLAGFILPHHLSSSRQLADLFTKSLSHARFRVLLSKMSLADVHHSHLAGGCKNGGSELENGEGEAAVRGDGAEQGKA